MANPGTPTVFLSHSSTVYVSFYLIPLLYMCLFISFPYCICVFLSHSFISFPYCICVFLSHYPSNHPKFIFHLICLFIPPHPIYLLNTSVQPIY
ncbi:hypothetical protein B484DRAFT_340906 [Ochromonadaceae sp. CCMP2298]|nr:hypothetical protein B484DRAFT_340906 [Ochromonadaceae sp. CCMP2298]